MKKYMHTITAMVRKYLVELLPLVLLVAAVNGLEPAISSLDLESPLEFWTVLKENFYWLASFLSLLLMVSVIQQSDSALRTNHTQ